MFERIENPKNQKREDRRFYAWVHAVGDCHATGVRDLEEYDIVEYRGVAEDRKSNDIDDDLRVHDEDGNPHWISPGQLSHMDEVDVLAVRMEPSYWEVLIEKAHGPLPV